MPKTNKKLTNYNRRHSSDYGFWRTLYITWFLYFVVWPAAIFFYNIKVEGRGNIKDNERYIFTANHRSYIDPPLISLAANRPVAYMAKEELFTSKNALLRFLVTSLGAFAVNREKPELATFKTIKDIISKTKWSLGVFPQGKICLEPELCIEKGFVAIAKSAQADIVPIAICGFDGYAKKLFEKNITLKIGKPIPYNLENDAIIEQWTDFISKEAGYKQAVKV